MHTIQSSNTLVAFAVLCEPKGDAKVAVQHLLDKTTVDEEDDAAGGTAERTAVGTLGAELAAAAATHTSSFNEVTAAAAAAVQANAVDALSAELVAIASASAADPTETPAEDADGGAGGGEVQRRRRRASNVKSKNFNRMSMAVLEHQLALAAASGKWSDREDVRIVVGPTPDPNYVKATPDPSRLFFIVCFRAFIALLRSNPLTRSSSYLISHLSRITPPPPSAMFRLKLRGACKL